MEPQAILYHLARAEGLPEQAMRAAGERRHAAAPVLVDFVERYLAGETSACEFEAALFFAFHLLGEWRENSAYRPLARLLALEPSKVNDLLGDAITETSHRVMAGCRLRWGSATIVRGDRGRARGRIRALAHA
jgi:Protein of unknown function (DUF1186)